MSGCNNYPHSTVLNKACRCWCWRQHASPGHHAQHPATTSIASKPQNSTESYESRHQGPGVARSPLSTHALRLRACYVFACLVWDFHTVVSYQCRNPVSRGVFLAAAQCKPRLWQWRSRDSSQGPWFRVRAGPILKQRETTLSTLHCIIAEKAGVSHQLIATARSSICWQCSWAGVPTQNPKSTPASASYAQNHPLNAGVHAKCITDIRLLLQSMFVLLLWLGSCLLPPGLSSLPAAGFLPLQLLQSIRNPHLGTYLHRHLCRGIKKILPVEASTPVALQLPAPSRPAPGPESQSCAPP